MRPHDGTGRDPLLHTLMRDARRTVAAGLAGAFLAGAWEEPAMTRRGQRAVGRRRVWLRDLAADVRHAYPDAPRDRPRQLAASIASAAPLAAAFAAAEERSEPAPAIIHWFLTPTAMGPRRWPVLPLETVGDLAAAVGLTPTVLRWYADPAQLSRRVPDERLRHYRYRWVPKGDGGVRLIEAPKPVLKHLQRVMLREILDRVPAHPAAHGFCVGRGARSYATVHTGRAVLVHLDLEDFFGSVGAARIYGIYRSCGYPEEVAHLLTGLSTTSVGWPVRAAAPTPPPHRAAGHHRLGQHLMHPHLPQGAPTSPALANLAAFRLDRRLAGLAARAGLAYSRYADDIALSTADPRRADQIERIVALVRTIVTEEGFRLNERKTTVRRAGQHQRLAGIVVNRRPNLDRREYDRLKATLTNAARHGPAGQNRDGHPDYRAHLLGRVAWAEHLNPARGGRLRRLAEQIEWGAGGGAAVTDTEAG